MRRNRTLNAAMVALMACCTCMGGCAWNMNTGRLEMNAAINQDKPAPDELGEVAGVAVEIKGITASGVFGPFELAIVLIDGVVRVGGKLIATFNPLAALAATPGPAAVGG